jgi:hypothetical protein
MFAVPAAMATGTANISSGEHQCRHQRSGGTEELRAGQRQHRHGQRSDRVAASLGGGQQRESLGPLRFGQGRLGAQRHDGHQRGGAQPQRGDGRADRGPAASAHRDNRHGAAHDPQRHGRQTRRRQAQPVPEHGIAGTRESAAAGQQRQQQRRRTRPAVQPVRQAQRADLQAAEQQPGPERADEPASEPRPPRQRHPRSGDGAVPAAAPGPRQQHGGDGHGQCEAADRRRRGKLRQGGG